MVMGVLFKDFYREIRRNLGRFLSMFFIVALGTAFFSGLRSTGYDMKYSADRFYKDYNLMDLRVIGTLGLTSEDISDIEKVPGVKSAYGGKTVDGLSIINDKEFVIHTVMKTDGINDVYLTEGRLPKKEDECLMDSGALFNNGVAIGDTISLYLSGDDDITDTLRVSEFKVVGKGNLPYYTDLTRDQSNIGDGSCDAFILVTPEAFDTDYFTESYVEIEGAREKMNLSDSYMDVVNPVREMIEDSSEEWAERRYKSIYDEAYEKITDAEKEIADGKREIEDGKVELEDGKKKIEDAKKELADAKDELDRGWRELRKGEKELADRERELSENKDGLLTNLRQLTMLESSGVDVSAELAMVEAGFAEISAGEEQLAAAKAELEKNRRKLIDGQREYDEKSADAEIEIADAERDIAKAEEDIAKAEKDIAEAEVKIADGKKELSDIPESKWYVLDREMMAGVVGYDQNATRMDSLGDVFPVMFFLVAALVCLTAMTRMVDEQRMHIGTLKALGFSGGVISARFICYALLATVFGSILGISFGERFLPWIIAKSYGIMFTGMPYIITIVNWKEGLLGLFAAVLSTGIATVFACAKQLRENPAALMRPEPPKNGKRMLLERIGFIWKRLSFTRKSTIRNLFRYKKRFVMTVIGVGGCMALLLVGYGIRDSIQVIAKQQYINLFKYEAQITLSSDIITEEKNEFAAEVSEYDGMEDVSVISFKTVDLLNGKTTREAFLFVPESTEKIFDFITLRDRKTGMTYDYPTEGVMISEKTATMLGVNEGDTITIRHDDADREITVTKIVENYIQHYAFISSKTYESLFSEAPDYNTLFVNYEKKTEEEEKEFGMWLMDHKEASGVSFVTDLEVNIDDMLSVLNDIIWILIISAGILAFIVLYNLNSINIMERRRELATLKVLGFYDSEVAMYIFRENIVLTICGIVLGLGLGSLLHRFVIVTVEVDLMMFGRLISTGSYILSSFVTFGFSILVNIYMYFVLRKIDMVESLKSVE